MRVPDRLASGCPGCGMPLLFDELELLAPDAPANREVMCALCGTVTSRLLLRAQSYVDPRFTRRTTPW